MTDMLAEMKAEREKHRRMPRASGTQCGQCLATGEYCPTARALDVAIGHEEALRKVELLSLKSAPAGFAPVVHEIKAISKEALAAAQAKWEGK